MEQQYDTAQIALALSLLDWGEDVCNELRCLGRKPGSRHGTIAGYFTDPLLMGRAACEWSGKVEGVYLVLNPPVRRVLARSANRLELWARHTTADEDVARRCWLFVDLDPARPAGVSSTEEEHALAWERAVAVRDYLLSRDTPGRLVLADSGNGAHVLVEFPRPNDKESEGVARGTLRHLADRFTDERIKVDQTTYNAARLCKLYGTKACKGDAIEGNPHRLAKIVEISNG